MYDIATAPIMCPFCAFSPPREKDAYLQRNQRASVLS